MSLHEPIKPYHFPNIQKVLPAVYDDSLSYYEVLCKVLYQLNEVTDGYNSLYDAMVVLQQAWVEFENGGYLHSFEEFIHTWFEENQDEINQMLEDGFGREIIRLDNKIEEGVRTAINTSANNLVPFPTPPLSKYGQSGQVISSNGDGTTTWANPVIVTSAIAEPFINEWLDEHPEATTTVQDGSITTAKLSNGAVTPEKLSQSVQNQIGSTMIDVIDEQILVNGTLNVYGAVTSANNRVVTKNYCELGKVEISSPYQITIHAYDKYCAYLGAATTWGEHYTVNDILTSSPNAYYIRVVVRKNDNSDITVEDVNLANMSLGIERSIYQSNIEFTDFGLTAHAYLQQGNINTTGINNNSAIRLRTPNYYPVSPDTTYKVAIFPNEGAQGTLRFVASYYDVADFSTPRLSSSDWCVNGDMFTTPADCNYVRIAVSYDDDGTITPEVVRNIGIYEKLPELPEKGYLIDSSLQRHALSWKALGSLTYKQSFCIYNGKYYSTDGSHVAIQDSSFILENTYDISLGHGNSFQLGNGNIAYVSGWNDNTIYCLNLDTMTIDDTISLPTTGYTTCAVDENRKRIYIFQRDTNPSTETNYNFIVYDYENESILSTNKTIAFAAMQSCDFINDRIFVVNGLGTSDAPNGWRVYDTSGNVIADYIFPTLTREPEGVMIDRTTFDLYLSTGNTSLFKVIRI